MNLTIRNIRPDDIAAVVSMLFEFAEFENLVDQCTINEARLAEALFGNGAVASGLIAVDADTPIGYAIFYPNFSSFRGERGMYLEDIYVRGEYRGMAIGKKLIRAIARIAAERGFERIDFQVLGWNTNAINFYEKLGAVRNDDERHFKIASDAFRLLAS